MRPEQFNGGGAAGCAASSPTPKAQDPVRVSLFGSMPVFTMADVQSAKIELAKAEAQIHAEIKRREEAARNAPMANLTRVRYRHGTGRAMFGVVIFGDAQKLYVRGFTSIDMGAFTVVNDNGYGSTYETWGHLRDVWEEVK